MNDNYISRKTAVNAVHNVPKGNWSSTRYAHELQAVPAADVAPVVHAEWIPKDTDGSWRVDTCSACKKDTHYTRYAPAYDFCPSCGAKMDGGGKE